MGDPHAPDEFGGAAQVAKGAHPAPLLLNAVIRISAPGDDMEVSTTVFDEVHGLDRAGLSQCGEDGLRDQCGR